MINKITGIDHPTGGEQITKTVQLNLKPGEAYSFPTGLKIDTITFSYGGGC